MAIEVTCTCGARLRARDELVGKQAPCPKCKATLLIPAPDDLMEVDSPPTVKDWEIPEHLLPPEGVDPARIRELKRRQRRHRAAASRPGLVPVDYLHYVSCFPKWPSIWLATTILFLILGVAVHWSLLLGTLLTAACLVLSWRAARNNLLVGDVNPGIVISTSPPQIATLINLSKGKRPLEVIKVLTHPLGRMTGATGEVGQPLATVSTFTALDSHPHWIDVDPIAVGCATRDSGEMARVEAEIDPAEWQVLRRVLKQLPADPDPGLYRIDTKRDHAPARRRIERSRLAELTEEYLDHRPIHDCYLASSGIPEKELAPYRQWSAIADALALVRHGRVGRGFLITSTHFMFSLADDLQGQVPWEMLRCATALMDEFEIWLRNNQRHRLRLSAFNDYTTRLESLLNAVARECEQPLSAPADQ